MSSPQLQATFKSQDTEEWLDIHFTRPLGLLWARFFNHFGVHPNVVTVLSIILGAAAGVFFYFESLPCTVAGILLLVWANLYDSADGQLARMTGKKTRAGRILDGFAGDVWFFTIYAAICLRLQGKPIPGTETEWGVWIWLLAAVSGFVCHGRQCRTADYYRNIHLFFIKGKAGSELDTFAKLRAEMSALSWKKDCVWMAFLYFYGNYTHGQEKDTPRFQRLRQTLAERFPDGDLPETLRADFRAGSLPLMKYANILTFNTRAIVLYVTLLAFQPWLYFAFETTVMTALEKYMRVRHERLCDKVRADVLAGKYDTTGAGSPAQTDNGTAK